MNTKNLELLNTKYKLHILQGVFAFDRLSFYINVTNPSLPITKLSNHHNKIRVVRSEYGHGNVNKTIVEVSQPDCECLEILYKYIKHSGCRVQFKYIEIACDFLAKDLSDAEDIKLFLLSHVYIDRIHSELKTAGEEKTYYYRPRASNGKKASINFVLYHDKYSKLKKAELPKPCCHMELRLSGSNTIQNFGIVTFSDLIDFDFAQFFDNHIKLVKLRSKISLARRIKKSTEVSGTALRNFANKILDESCVDTAFVMQKLVDQHKEVKKELKPIPFWRLCK